MFIVGSGSFLGFGRVHVVLCRRRAGSGREGRRGSGDGGVGWGRGGGPGNGSGGDEAGKGWRWWPFESADERKRKVKERWRHQRTAAVDGVVVRGRRDMPSDVVYELTDHLIGTVPTLGDLADAAREMTNWYRQQGFIASAVVLESVPEHNDPLVVFRAWEPRLVDIKLRFQSGAMPDKESENEGQSEEGTGSSTSTKTKDAKNNNSRTATGQTASAGKSQDTTASHLPSSDTVEDTDGTTTVSTVMSILGLKMGKHFRWAPDSIPRLERTRLFRNLDVEMEYRKRDEVVLHLKATELPFVRLEPGIGIRSDGQVYGDCRLIHNNVQGKWNTFSFQWGRRLGQEKSVLYAEYLDRRLESGLPLAFKLHAYREPSRARKGMGDRDGFRMCLLNRLHGPFQMESCLYGERVGGFEESAMVHADHLASNLDISFDARRIATQGKRHRLALDRGFGFGDLSVPFLRGFAETAVYVPVSLGKLEGAHFAGLVNLRMGNPSLPEWQCHWLGEREYLGGVAACRGFDHGELGLAHASSTISLEFRVPVTRNLTLVLFSDSLMPAEPSCRIAPLPLPIGPGQDSSRRFAHGIGLRINNQVALEWALNDRNIGNFHFHVGSVNF